MPILPVGEVVKSLDLRTTGRGGVTYPSQISKCKPVLTVVAENSAAAIHRVIHRVVGLELPA